MASCEVFATKAELRATEARLQALINRKLDSSERQPIIQSSIAGSINVLRPEILIVQGIATAAARVAADALGIGRGAASAAAAAAGIARSAASAAAAAAALATRALAIIAGVLVTLAAITATLAVLGARIDALEGYVDSVAATASEAYSNALSAIGIGRAAQSTANVALGAANQAQGTASQALGAASQAQGTANQALGAANRAQATADYAVLEAGKAQATAERAIGIGTDARAKAERAIDSAAQARAIADKALALALQALMRMVIGTTGAKGDPGSPGAKGEQGARGATGAKGEQGIQGVAGATGAKGERGERGERGLTGAPGRSADLGLLDSLRARIAQLERQMREQDILNRQAIGLIQALPITLASNSTFQAAATTAAAAGTCRTTQPGGCLDTRFNNLNNNFNSGLQGLLQRLDLAIQAGQGALLNTINGTVNTINTKLGAQVTGGISASITTAINRVNKVGEFLQIDRLLNILIWWQTLHNAFMLSNNIATTLTSTLSQALAALPGNTLLGIPTEAEGGTPLNIGEQINSMFENTIKNAVGTENYTAITATWAQANRIYQATTNLLFSIQSLIQGVQSLIELTGEYTGKIGNALKSFGLVGERAYNWMSERMNNKTAWMEKLENNLQSASGMASNLESIVSSVVSTQSAITELTNQKTAFDQALRGNNTPIETQADANKTASQSPDISPTNLDKSLDNNAK